MSERKIILVVAGSHAKAREWLIEHGVQPEAVTIASFADDLIGYSGPLFDLSFHAPLSGPLQRAMAYPRPGWVQLTEAQFLSAARPPIDSEGVL